MLLLYQHFATDKDEILILLGTFSFIS